MTDPDSLAALARLVRESHDRSFGKTALPERLRDLSHQAAELAHHRDRAHMVEEAGDLGWALLQLCNEADVDLGAAVRASVAKLAARHAGRKVALLGVSANPITNAHLTLGLEICALTDVDEVWFYVAGEHAWGKKLMPAAHRLEMVRRAVARYAKLKVSDFEVAHGPEIYARTRETAEILRDFLLPAFPGTRFSWVMGSDAAQSFHRWRGAEWMAANLDIHVVHRLGYDFDKAGSLLADPRHIYWRDEVVTSNISSTLVRERGKSYDAAKLVALVPEVVWDYLREHRLLDPEVLV